MIKDPNILLSVINTKLRDYYDSFEELCDKEDYSKDEAEEIINILKNNGYIYDSKSNQFK